MQKCIELGKLSGDTTPRLGVQGTLLGEVRPEGEELAGGEEGERVLRRWSVWTKAQR